MAGAGGWSYLVVTLSWSRALYVRYIDCCVRYVRDDRVVLAAISLSTNYFQLAHFATSDLGDTAQCQ